MTAFICQLRLLRLFAVCTHGRPRVDRVRSRSARWSPHSASVFAEKYFESRCILSLALWFVGFFLGDRRLDLFAFSCQNLQVRKTRRPLQRSKPCVFLCTQNTCVNSGYMYIYLFISVHTHVCMCLVMAKWPDFRKLTDKWTVATDISTEIWSNITAGITRNCNRESIGEPWRFREPFVRILSGVERGADASSPSAIARRSRIVKKLETTRAKRGKTCSFAKTVYSWKNRCNRRDLAAMIAITYLISTTYTVSVAVLRTSFVKRERKTQTERDNCCSYSTRGRAKGVRDERRERIERRIVGVEQAEEQRRVGGKGGAKAQGSRIRTSA